MKRLLLLLSMSLAVCVGSAYADCMSDFHDPQSQSDCCTRAQQYCNAFDPGDPYCMVYFGCATISNQHPVMVAVSYMTHAQKIAVMRGIASMIKEDIKKDTKVLTPGPSPGPRKDKPKDQ